MTVGDSVGPRVVIVGSVMIDLVAYADPLPKDGETVRGSRFQIGSGGKGANQAVVARRLGSEVTFVARTGRDVFGELCLASLQEDGIDTSSVRAVDGCTTGTAPIWVQSDGTNRIIIVPGANDALTPADVEAELAGVEQADALVCQLEIPEEAVVGALQIGRRLGAIRILNPAPVPGAASVQRLFGEADWIVPNEHEFQQIWGAPPTDDQILKAAGEWGCGVAVTLGEKGAAVTVNDEVIHRHPPQVNCVDTTGAGDAFVGAFAHALANDMDAISAADLGNICGALSTERLGTQTSFPTAGQVRRVFSTQYPAHGTAAPSQ